MRRIAFQCVAALALTFVLLLIVSAAARADAELPLRKDVALQDRTPSLPACNHAFEWFDPLTPTGAQETECIRRQALSGNADAAYWLGKHFSYGGNLGDNVFWTRLSAEYGNCNATKAYLNTLRPKNAPDVQELLKRWSAKVKENC